MEEEIPSGKELYFQWYTKLYFQWYTIIIFKISNFIFSPYAQITNQFSINWHWKIYFLMHSKHGRNSSKINLAIKQGFEILHIYIFKSTFVYSCFIQVNYFLDCLWDEFIDVHSSQIANSFSIVNFIPRRAIDI